MLQIHLPTEARQGTHMREAGWIYENRMWKRGEQQCTSGKQEGPRKLARLSVVELLSRSKGLLLL